MDFMTIGCRSKKEAIEIFGKDQEVKIYQDNDSNKMFAIIGCCDDTLETTIFTQRGTFMADVKYVGTTTLIETKKAKIRILK